MPSCKISAEATTRSPTTLQPRSGSASHSARWRPASDTQPATDPADDLAYEGITQQGRGRWWGGAAAGGRRGRGSGHGCVRVALTVTVTGATRSGYVTVYPDGYSPPRVSNLNFADGQTTANLVLAQVPASGIVDLRVASSGTAQLVADVAGYYLDGEPTPRRDVDAGRPGTSTGHPHRSRGAQTPCSRRRGSAATGDRCGRGPGHTGVSAVAITVTVTAATRGGYVAVYPDDGSPAPRVSNLNFAAGQTTANLVITRVPADGIIDLPVASFGTAQLIADLAAYTHA